MISPLIYDFSFFFFNDTATTEIYTLSLHDALPISDLCGCLGRHRLTFGDHDARGRELKVLPVGGSMDPALLEQFSSRSEEHTSELQSRQYLVCRLLLEKKKKKHTCS